MEPTLGEEPGVPGPQKNGPGDGSAKNGWERAVFFGGIGERNSSVGLGLHGGNSLNGGNPHFTPQNDHV